MYKNWTGSYKSRLKKHNPFLFWILTLAFLELPWKTDFRKTNFNSETVTNFLSLLTSFRATENLRMLFFNVADLDPPRIKQGTRNLRIVDEESTEVEVYVGTKLTVISETQVKVRCEAPIDPPPAISWEIPGKNSDLKDMVSLSKDNSTLTLGQLRAQDSGVYTCTATNNVGQDSKSSNIEILCKFLKLCLWQLMTSFSKFSLVSVWKHKRLSHSLTTLSFSQITLWKIHFRFLWSRTKRRDRGGAKMILCYSIF